MITRAVERVAPSRLFERERARQRRRRNRHLHRAVLVIEGCAVANSIDERKQTVITATTEPRLDLCAGLAVRRLHPTRSVRVVLPRTGVLEPTEIVDAARHSRRARCVLAHARSNPLVKPRWKKAITHAGPHLNVHPLVNEVALGDVIHATDDQRKPIAVVIPVGACGAVRTHHARALSGARKVNAARLALAKDGERVGDAHRAQSVGDSETRPLVVAKDALPVLWRDRRFDENVRSERVHGKGGSSAARNVRLNGHHRMRGRATRNRRATREQSTREPSCDRAIHGDVNCSLRGNIPPEKRHVVRHVAQSLVRRSQFDQGRVVGRVRSSRVWG